MAKGLIKTNDLRAGEFYGQVPENRRIDTAVLSEVVHSQKVDLPAHSHELAFFTLLLNGSYSESYGRKSFAYRPMSISWHPSETAHKDEVGKNGGRFFMIEIGREGLARLNDYAHSADCFFEHGGSLSWLAFRLYHEFKNWQVCSELIAEGLTLEMLAHSARKTNAFEKQQPAWLLRITEKLNDEFAANISSDELAADAGVHPVHLAATFRRFYHCTIGEYVQRRRVTHSAALLADKEVPLSDIALSAGFADQSHFTRIFKRITGITPGAFRASLK